MVKVDGVAAFGLRGFLLASAAFATTGATDLPPSSNATSAVAQVPVSAPIEAAWSVASARQLLSAIEGAPAEGLHSSDYNPDGLRAAIDAGAGPDLDRVAQAAALTLAHDYYFGRVGDREAFDWHIERSAYEMAGLSARLDQAVAAHKVGPFLASLLPTDARYAALRDALADAHGADRDRIRANMERWRWMPRDLGSDYLYVNVPSYRLRVVQDGEATSTYTVVVGAPATPTPQMVSPATSLVVNPWWNVPQSIIRKENMRPGKAGFVYASANGQASFRQPPGPRNALGKIKFNLINDQAIYLHDTPAKAGFARDQRDLSHGCVRVKDIAGLASELMRDGGDDGELQDALGQSKTATVMLPKRWPVYLVYFTMDRGDDGDLVTYGDPYDRDAKLIAQLDGVPDRNAGMQIASN
ncbi:murein L,D-transpeptidase YcbB/YkuD [Sphingomonas vulcanisoli]|uniref:Murein L,D-transpeptidase YcbB/YkuD n=1 Tax=Sphingomonas vulcanisoli TaxID=1658060 RepID=A0ABX0TLM9_9SPHN|nr:L,D-transpeptidase family protein [Sphingomonas vulcanisoli]NIJ06422.1 murein L,D-transpeptidase YcbB/YkuD [Sphingomonas vulcanisoli]